MEPATPQRVKDIVIARHLAGDSPVMILECVKTSISTIRRIIRDFEDVNPIDKSADMPVTPLKGRWAPNVSMSQASEGDSESLEIMSEQIDDKRMGRAFKRLQLGCQRAKRSLIVAGLALFMLGLMCMPNSGYEIAANFSATFASIIYLMAPGMFVIKLAWKEEEDVKFFILVSFGLILVILGSALAYQEARNGLLVEKPKGYSNSILQEAYVGS